MKPHPKIIDRILEAIRDSRILLHRRPYPARRRLRRLPTGPGPRPEERRQEGRLLERGPHPPEIRVPRPGPPLPEAQSPDWNSTASSPPMPPVSSGWARSAQCVANRKLLINIDHHESNTRYARPELGLRARALDRRTHLPPAENRQMADHQADRRLPLHRRLDRHRLVPVPHHPPRHLSCRRRTGAPRRRPGQDLRRGLPILSPFPRPPAAPRLQPFPPDPPKPDRLFLAQEGRFRPHRRGERRHRRAHRPHPRHCAGGGRLRVRGNRAGAHAHQPALQERAR